MKDRKAVVDGVKTIQENECRAIVPQIFFSNNSAVFSPGQ